MAEIDWVRVRIILEREEEQFSKSHPRSRRMFERACKSMIGGVPMNWMIEWPGPFPIFAKKGRGSMITDVDGHTYVDFCLGDTGAMFGHSPKATVDAAYRQMLRGITMMLPTEDSIWVGKELTRRFGLPYWQIAMTATDANRFALRVAREATGRSKILVFNGCYHGTVDETLVRLVDGKVEPRTEAMPPPVDPNLTTKIVEFNDSGALRRALEPHDVAAVLMEPALTNCGIVLPESGYLDAVREITHETGTVWIDDETHTWCAGPGGYAKARGVQPDMITLGKPVAGGIPAAAFGLNKEIFDKTIANLLQPIGVNGAGGTVTGNALALAAMRATLAKVVTNTAFHHMIALAKRFEEGVQGAIRKSGVPWHVIRIGARTEYQFREAPSKNGAEAMAAADFTVSRYMHLYALNRGILLTPFHNMALISPYSTAKDVDMHTQVFQDAIGEILA